jgi:hypothetical protein
MSKRADQDPDRIAHLAKLFDDELKDVSFPGVDRSLLDAAIHDHAEVEARVDAADAAAAAARSDLVAEQAKMQTLFERALAYLRVYAADDADLQAKLAGLEPTRRGPKRGRRSKGTEATEAKREGDGAQTMAVARAS